jgi:FkbM family methyltransferase
MVLTNEGWAIMENDSHIGKWVREEKRLDFDQNALPRLLPYIPKDKDVIDIGANIGSYTYAFYNQTNGWVYAYEPYLPSFKCLKHNMKGLEDVKIFNKALGETKSKTSILLNDLNYGVAHLVEGDEIDVITLDSIRLQNVGFIKIDAEGMEYNILKGGLKILNRFKPVMYIEINEGALNRYGNTPNDIYTLLKDLGYTFHNIYKEQPISGSQLDIICYT